MSNPTTAQSDIGESLGHTLKDPAQSGILSVLIREAGYELNPSRICKQAGLDLETFYENIDELEESGLVQYTYIVGNGPVYEVDRSNLSSAIEALA
ncbi:ArsR family transcriptional regulator [Haloferax sp. Atlit-10N]|uniref:helix-turn-helix transcriptional regulator n=1 Tax=unclassified Haloferax TaxID=2625095 RepID=UPI000E271C50|nr:MULTISPECIES: helix-turn-helix transcriptional regulator [unclassified Haloferax]RDZ44516.1 ArsR family transcriptional regulator [Haloferax sp. Atlit-16N]RDZ56325.1 ArsR family transcriptional regulator [Haloferax sp. Atlit-10N]